VTALRASLPAAVEVGARVSPERRPLSLEAFLAANSPPAGIDLGTAVRTSLAGGRAPGGMNEEGVVIEVVPPGCPVRSARVVYSRSTCATRSTVVRYVIQCWDRRVLRWTAELRVISH
jgi:hypothetical protein